MLGRFLVDLLLHHLARTCATGRHDERGLRRCYFFEKSIAKMIRVALILAGKMRVGNGDSKLSSEVHERRQAKG
jgi:hypothetical protein